MTLTVDGVRLTFWCPHCHDWHYHGASGPEFGAGDGHRVEHCLEPDTLFSGGYEIREVGPVTAEIVRQHRGKNTPRIP